METTHSPSNGMEEEDSEVQLKTFVCKMCNQPYKMHCRGNLFIRGFCPKCSNESNEDNSCDISNNMDDGASLDVLTDLTPRKSITAISLLHCQFCEKSFKLNKALSEHMKSRNNGKFGCDICNELFCNSKSLTEHRMEHTENLNCVIKMECVKEEEINETLTPKKSIQNGKRGAKKKCAKPVLEGKRRRCNLCNSFILSTDLDEHMDSHQKSQEFSTPRSKVTKIVDNNISNNIKNIQLELCRYSYYCDLCEEDFETMPSLKIHIENDKHANHIVSITGISLSCKQCDGLFSSLSDLKTHLTNINHIAKFHIKQNTIAIHQCNLCNLGFLDESDLSTHQYFHDEVINPAYVTVKSPKYIVSKKDTNTSIVKSENIDDLEESIEQIQDKFICSTCGNGFKSVLMLQKHGAQFHHNIYNNEKNPIQQIKLPVKKSLVCRICNKRFSSANMKCRHERQCRRTGNVKTSKQVLSMKCSKCNESFNCGGDVISHKLSQRHNIFESVSLYCIECKFAYGTLSSFTRHAKRPRHIEMHTPKVIDNSFCKICKFRFSTDAQTHITSYAHIGRYGKFLFESFAGTQKEKPANRKIRCKKCLKLFRTRLELNLHARSHAGFSGDYTCHICKRTFNQSSYLTKHMKSQHGPKIFSCEKCPKSFSLAYMLKLHRRKHRV